MVLLFKRISIVSSRSSKSHSILLREFLNSVVVHSTSAPLESPNSLHLKYSPRVLLSALKTSLERGRRIKWMSRKIDQTSKSLNISILSAYSIRIPESGNGVYLLLDHKEWILQRHDTLRTKKKLNTRWNCRWKWGKHGMSSDWSENCTRKMSRKKSYDTL